MRDLSGQGRDGRTDSLLEVHGLRAGYGATPILQGVEFTVGSGEIVAIIGRNGVGKTDADEHPDRPAAGDGRVRSCFEREDITSGSRPIARARRGIGYIPQGREIFPRLTVWENLRWAT